MTDSLISSSVSVTAGDIAKAVYGLTKQQLIAERERFLKQSEEVFNEISSEAQVWFDDKLAQLKASDRYTECFALFQSIKKVFSLDCSFAITHSFLRFQGETIHSAWVRSIVWYDIYGSITLNLPKSPSIEIFLSFVDDEADEDCGNVPEWVELISCLIDTVDASPLLDSLRPKLKQYIAFRNEAARLGDLVNGKPDPTSSMTLEEQVTNTITLKAVENMPGLKDTFDALALSSSLISGYLK